MDFALVFKFLIETFNKERIDFAIIGGFALQFSGVSRATQDIDLLILSQDSSRIKEIMFKKGYRLIHESKDVLNFISDKIELGRVDFLLAHRKYAIAMLKRADVKEIFRGELKVKVLKSEDQIGLKIQSSTNDPQRFHQDMADIESLIRNNFPNIDIELLKEYFALFERTEELEKIIKEIKDVK